MIFQLDAANFKHLPVLNEVCFDPHRNDDVCKAPRDEILGARKESAFHSYMVLHIFKIVQISTRTAPSPGSHWWQQLSMDSPVRSVTISKPCGSVWFREHSQGFIESLDIIGNHWVSSLNQCRNHGVPKSVSMMRFSQPEETAPLQGKRVIWQASGVQAICQAQEPRIKRSFGAITRISSQQSGVSTKTSLSVDQSIIPVNVGSWPPYEGRIKLYTYYSQWTWPKWVVLYGLWTFSHKFAHPKSIPYYFSLPLIYVGYSYFVWSARVCT